MRRSTRLFCLLGLGAASTLTTAYADDKDVIDYRQHVMNTLNEQSEALGQVLSTVAPEDNIAAHFEAIALTASIALKAFQPKVQGGEAKPEVWTHWDDFAKRMNEFVEKTAAAAKTAKSIPKDQVANTIDIVEVLTCKGCHDTYREEKKH